MKYIACVASLMFVQVSFANADSFAAYREDRSPVQTSPHGKVIQISAQCLVSGPLVGNIASDKTTRQDFSKQACVDIKAQAEGFGSAADRYSRN